MYIFAAQVGCELIERAAAQSSKLYYLLSELHVAVMLPVLGLALTLAKPKLCLVVLVLKLAATFNLGCFPWPMSQCQAPLGPLAACAFNIGSRPF
jgi:hypothetical protein